ncbi:hypothetical protein AB5I41_15590 [Sphingomonas sp. MMS24-JH45]
MRSAAGTYWSWAQRAIATASGSKLRTGGVSATPFRDERVGLHAILYPAPIGFPGGMELGARTGIRPRARPHRHPPAGGRLRAGHGAGAALPLGPFMPYARWQTYRGGWKALPNAPRLETDEFELGIEFHPIPPIKFTLAYAHMDRAEADERRTGRAEGDLIRTQLQWNY